MVAEYLVILIVLLIITIAVDIKYKVKLYSSLRERIIIPLHFFVIGILWDSIAVYRGHWSFEGTGLVGLKIGLLPIEEYLFFLIVPYSILTAYNALKKDIK